MEDQEEINNIVLDPKEAFLSYIEGMREYTYNIFDFLDETECRMQESSFTYTPELKQRLIANQHSRLFGTADIISRRVAELQLQSQIEEQFTLPDPDSIRDDRPFNPTESPETEAESFSEEVVDSLRIGTVRGPDLSPRDTRN